MRTRLSRYAKGAPNARRSRFWICRCRRLRRREPRGSRRIGIGGEDCLGLIVAESREGGSALWVDQQLGGPGSFTRPPRSACLGRLGRRSTLTAFIRTAMLASERSEEHTSELQSLRHLVCR